MNAKLSFYLYKMVQSLRREPVFDVLSQLRESQWYPIDRLKEMQLCKLKLLVHHAYHTVPFYQEQFKELGAEPEDIKSIEDYQMLPILTKEEIKRYGTKLGSLKPSTAITVEKTAGSTGIPLKILADKNFWAHQHANIFRMLSWYGVDLGVPRAAIWGRYLEPANKLKSVIRDMFVNKIRLAAHEVPEKALVFYHRMKKMNVQYLIGYSNSLARFAHILQNNLIDASSLKLKVIVCTSELLGEHQKTLIENTFNAPVANLYGATEVGIAGVECPDGTLHIPSESVLVESVPSVTHSLCKAVVTELNNTAMPLLRYEIGDFFSEISEQKCSCGRCLPGIVNLVGRSASIIKTPDGKEIHDCYLDYIFRDIDEKKLNLSQYQFLRTGENDFECHVVCPGELEQANWEFLELKMRDLLWPELHLKVKKVESIPLLTSGKINYYVDARDPEIQNGVELG